MTQLVDLSKMRHGTELLKRGFAKMQEGGVIMDVVTPEQAHIAEDAGATAVMALERVPADIRADGGVARMSHPDLIRGIIDTTSIPVMAKARIGHDEEARILQELGVDMVDESEVLTPADPFYHIAKNDFTIPFVCGCTNLGEACRRIMEGAAMIRTKGEAGTGNVVSAVQHARLLNSEMRYVGENPENTSEFTNEYLLVKNTSVRAPKARGIFFSSKNNYVVRHIYWDPLTRGLGDSANGGGTQWIAAGRAAPAAPRTTTRPGHDA